jgi:UDP-N-acetylmuramyl tripeptide synthase
MEAKAICFKTADRIINLDDPWAGELILRADCEIFSFFRIQKRGGSGANKSALHDRVEFEAVSSARSSEWSAHPRSFTVYNALGSIDLGLTMGIDISRIAGVLKQAGGVKGRMRGCSGTTTPCSSTMPNAGRSENLLVR